MGIRTIGVVGSGAMGTGIAHIMAQYGYNVILSDVNNDHLERALASIGNILDSKIRKGKWTEDKKTELLGQIKITIDLNEMTAVDLIIEAITENMDAKIQLFSSLEKICRAETIFATNASTMSITKMASALSQPERMVGLHFFNPAPVMKLVEIIRGYYTSDEIIVALKELVRSIGKESIEVKKDTPGFVVNRLMLTQFREALLVLEEGIASVEDIDKAMTLGLNHPMGPFTLMDFTGNDIAFDTLKYMHTELAQPNWAPPIVLKRIVNAGRIGKKVQKGWFNYK